MLQSFSRTTQYKRAVFLAFSWLILISCENPGGFERVNPRDAGGLNFEPVLQKNDSIELRVSRVNQVQIKWPQVFGIEKYQLLRRTESDEDYSFITEINDYRDTIFTDQVPISDSYYYRITAIAENGRSLTIDSGRILSNWVDSLTFSFNESSVNISDSPSFAMKAGENRYFIHFLDSFNESPHFSILDLNTNTWQLVNYNNQRFSELNTNIDHVRPQEFFPLDENHFLIIKYFRSGQSNLGYICDLETGECDPIGENNFEEDGQFRDLTFTRLDNHSIIFTGGVVTLTLQENFALIYDETEKTLTKVNSPLNKMLPSTLTTLNDGNVMGCELSHGEEKTTCQIYNRQLNTWKYVHANPLNHYELNSILLDDGRVFFLDRWDGITNNAQIYDPKSDSWKLSPPTFYSTFLIYYRDFKNPIHKIENGNILILSHSFDDGYIYRIGSYFIEEYNPVSDSWIKTYKLPDYVKNIYNFIKVSEGKYLVTYRREIFGKPESAFFFPD